MALIEVKFRPTDAMRVYQGTVKTLDPLTGKPVKPMLIISKPGKYSLPDHKAAQLCRDFPDNFSCDASFDISGSPFEGGTIYLEPGGGIPDHDRMEFAPDHTG